MGRIAYEVYGGSVFTQGNELCHSGYYHGAMEAFLKEKGTVHIADDMKTLCSSFPTTFVFGRLGSSLDLLGRWFDY